MKTTLIATHNGQFHADEATAVAIYKLATTNPVSVIRTRDQAVLDKADVVIDVGSVYDPATDRYDHHQYQGGTASAGMLWLNYGRMAIINMYEHLTVQQVQTAFEYVQETMINDIDNIDTGTRRPAKGEFTYSHVISSFNSSTGTNDQEFDTAVEFAMTILANTIRNAALFAIDKSTIEEIISANPDVPVFNRYYLGMGDAAKLAGYSSYVFFDERSKNYRVQITEGSGPISQDVNLLPNVTFVHPSGFICGTIDLQTAISIASKDYT